MSRIFVTGMGMISAIGNTVSANRDALINGKCGISDLTLFSTKYAGLLPCGEIKISTEALKEKLKAHERGVTRTNLIALHALHEAIEDAGLTNQQLSSADTALIGASTVG